MSDYPLRIACFISPHGFGHAARSASILKSIGDRLNDIHFDIFTRVPHWFFTAEAINHTYHSVSTDVGLVQTNPLEHDIKQTLLVLDQYFGDFDANVNALAENLKRNHCSLVLCDISPLGIAAAHKADIPTVLIENFTWDWLYKPYAKQQPVFNNHITRLRDIFHSSDFLIQTRPVCEQRNADLVTHPVSRRIRQSSASVRQRLNVPQAHRLISITMGGIRGEVNFLDDLTKCRNTTFVLPGNGKHVRRIENCIILPQQSDVYHPDLINASDIVIGKLGYSTVAEVYYSGAPFIYVMREHFRESSCLARFVESHMQGMPLTVEEFNRGAWLDCLAQFQTDARPARNHLNGADQAADTIVNILNSQHCK